jgi:hypothetical protein
MTDLVVNVVEILAEVYYLEWAEFWRVGAHLIDVESIARKQCHHC